MNDPIQVKRLYPGMYELPAFGLYLSRREDRKWMFGALLGDGNVAEDLNSGGFFDTKREAMAAANASLEPSDLMKDPG